MGNAVVIEKMTTERFLRAIQEVIADPNNCVESAVLGLFQFLLDNQEKLGENIQDIADWFDADSNNEWHRFFSSCSKTNPCDWIATTEDWSFFGNYYNSQNRERDKK